MSQDQPENTTPYEHPGDPNLRRLENAMGYRDGMPHLRVDLGSDNITVSGNVNIADHITVDNTNSNPVPVTIRNSSLTVAQGTIPWQISGNAYANSNTNPIYTQFINNSLAVTGTFWQATQPVSIASMPTTPVTGSVSISSLPEVEIKNDTGNPVPVSGNVTATITDVITVIAEEKPGQLYAINNAAINTNRGWTMDDTMRPVISFRVNSSGTTISDIVKIIEYEIGNNNANQSTIVYEWWEGDIAISGAAIPAWTTVGTKTQYRIYQDKYSSNTGNIFTANGAKLRHSGIIIGKNTSGDEGPADMTGGATPNMLTLCMRRVDNSTKLDIWFAFTFKELI